LRIYEINTRIFCDRFDRISEEQLSRLAGLGFDAVWLMGVWRIGEGAKKISRTISPDFSGSPYAIAGYDLSPDLGGLGAYQTFRERARAVGLKVLLDFIPNHMGLDSEWISENSKLFITSNPAVRKQDPSEFFLHPSGEVVAHGKDPYFPPWYDTAQLDYSSAELRSRQIDKLIGISKVADGVRCDMAMLILKDYIKQRWYPAAPDAWFDERMPAEFWGQAIAVVKQEAPGFIFLAEAYWGKEPDLQRLGFDLTYEKTVYDALVERSASRVYDRLRQPAQVLESSLFFIENHDEARAASVFSPDENTAAMALILSLPGSSLVHQGQMEGLKERLAIQLPRPIHSEMPDQVLEEAYEKLLRATAAGVFKAGVFRLFNSQDPDVVAFARVDSQTIAAYLGQIGGEAGHFARALLDVTPLAELARATSVVRITDMIGKNSVLVSTNRGSFTFVPASLGLAPTTRFCLVRVEPA
jgi:glycosidase